jgi:hypothetical protein
MPDASASAQVSVLVNDQSVPALTFPATTTGASATLTMFARNDGTAAIDLAVALEGDNYSIDAAGSTCDDLSSLAPGAYCHVRLRFAPSAAGAHDAMLTLASGQHPFALPLHGTATPLSSGLTTDVSSADFGVVYQGQSPPNQSVLLTNNGSSAVSVDSLAVTGPGFLLGANDCPSSLSPGGACSIMIEDQPTAVGGSTGSLTITSGSTQLVVALTGYAARTFKITMAGGGAGTVTSMPDVQCGAACLDNALGTVVLTASPSGGSVFAGWNSVCGTSSSCTIGPSDTDEAITARFEPMGSKAIAITMAGAAGLVYVTSNDVVLTECNSSCTTYVPNATSVTLYGYTPSTFTGWTGDCTSSTNDCNLGTVVNNRAATVTFARDDREIATLMLATPVTGLAMTPDGDLVVASANGVSRMTISGAVVWTTPIAGGATDLATDAAGNVYGRGGTGVFSLTSAGAMRWTHAVTVAKNPHLSIQSTIAVSPDGTVVAAHTSDGAAVLDGGTGADRFTITGLTSDGMAVAPDGTVAIGTASGDVWLNVQRYNQMGTALATLMMLPGENDASLTYDVHNALCSQTTYGPGDGVTVSRIDSSLASAFSKAEGTTDQPTHMAVVVASTGDIVAVRAATNQVLGGGVRLEAFSPTGTSTWTHTKTPSDLVPDFMEVDGVEVKALAADGNHHVAVGGTYNYDSPWIQIYQMP